MDVIDILDEQLSPDVRSGLKGARIIEEQCYLSFSNQDQVNTVLDQGKLSRPAILKILEAGELKTPVWQLGISSFCVKPKIHVTERVTPDLSNSRRTEASLVSLEGSASCKSSAQGSISTRGGFHLEQKVRSRNGFSLCFRDDKSLANTASSMKALL
jgi:hypothetical protein